MDSSPKSVESTSSVVLDRTAYDKLLDLSVGGTFFTYNGIMYNVECYDRDGRKSFSIRDRSRMLVFGFDVDGYSLDVVSTVNNFTNFDITDLPDFLDGCEKVDLDGVFCVLNPDCWRNANYLALDDVYNVSYEWQKFLISRTCNGENVSVRVVLSGKEGENCEFSFTYNKSLGFVNSCTCEKAFLENFLYCFKKSDT